MKWQVIDTQKAGDWHASLERFPETDIYFLPEYHRAHELNGDGVAHAFVAQDRDDLLFYPFMVRPIQVVGSGTTVDTWYDIETVYGYSGPLCTTANPSFLAGAWEIFAAWCLQEGVIAEFIRFNPLLDNHRYATDYCYVELDRETVTMRLDCSIKELWKGYREGHRTKIRKALRGGLVCKEVALDVGLSAFRGIYQETMDRSGASLYYHFSDAYFDYLCSALGEGLKLFFVWDADQLVAATLYLVHDDRIHAHLNGSDSSRWPGSGPNNLLLHTVASWGRERGFRWLHLGGGRTADPADSVFRFKAGISRERASFHTGKRVHNQEVYETLCSDWMRERSMAARPSYFLLYRLDQEAVQE